MNAEASSPEEPCPEPAFVEDLRLRLQAARTQEIAARAEARRLMRELAITRRLLGFFSESVSPARAATPAGVGPVPAALLTGEMRFHLDACQRHGTHTTITGWAFCPVAAWDGQAADTCVVLRHDAVAWSVAAGHMPRPDVAAWFEAQSPAGAGGARGLDGVGFTCEVLNDSLPRGVDLEIFLRLDCAGVTCERSTGQTLRL